MPELLARFRPRSNGKVEASPEDRPVVGEAWAVRQRIDGIGVHVDHDTVIAVTVSGSKVVDVVVETGASRTDAITSWLAHKRPKGKVVIAWSSPSAQVRQARNFPGVSDALAPKALAAVAEKMAKGQPAGRIGPVGQGGERRALVGVVPDGELAPLWAVIGNLDAVVVPPGLLLGGEGVYLGVGRASVEVAAVKAGWAEQVRVLRVGGLAELADELDKLGSGGWKAVERLLAGQQVEQQVVEVVTRYVTTLARQVEETISYWRREDLIVSPRLFVYGEGAGLPGLDQRLAAMLLPELATEAPGVDISCFDDPYHLARCWVALQAALAPQNELIGFVNTRRQQATERQEARAKSRRRVFGIAGAVLVAVLAVAVPYVLGDRDTASANAKLAQARSQLSQMARANLTQSFLGAAHKAWSANAAVEPDWARLLAYVYSSAPPGIAIQSVSVTQNSPGTPIQVQVTGAAAHGVYGLLQQWLTTLEAARGISDANSPQASAASSGAGNFTVSFDVAPTVFVERRPFPAGGGGR